VAAYVITKKIIGPDPIDEVMIDAEAYLETIDVTANPIYLMQFVRDGDDFGRMIILHET
jgi:hypothetical protein